MEKSDRNFVVYVALLFIFSFIVGCVLTYVGERTVGSAYYYIWACLIMFYVLGRISELLYNGGK
jgi:hypothetical protein